MKIIKKMLVIVIFLMSITMLAACAKVDDNLDKRDFIIAGENKVEVGYSVQLSVNNINEKDAISWSSSDEELATVDPSTGVVSAIKEGNVTISCKINDKLVNYEITITKLVVGIIINGVSEMNVGDTYKFTYTLSKNCNIKGNWVSSDTNVLSIDIDGNVCALSSGECIVSYSIEDNISEYKVKIKELKPSPSISVSGNNKLSVNETVQLSAILTNIEDGIVKWTSSDANILSVDDNGLVRGLKAGSAIITASIDGYDLSSTIEIQVEEELKISISGNLNITVGTVNEYVVTYNKSGYAIDLNFNNSNNAISVMSNNNNQSCKIVGVKTGTTRLTVTSKSDKNLKAFVVIYIKEMVQPINYTEEEIARANEILSKMTLEQKVGQMFIFSTGSETTFSSSAENTISKYHLGNIIYMGGNCANTNTLAKMSNAYQDAFNKYNGISGFISIDQEGGSVSRITSGGTHFISEMGLSATGDSKNAYDEGQGMGSELHAFGVNMDFAPVMDVNNNPNNPIIGIRSYADSPVRASDFGDNMIAGLRDGGVIGCAKHFPGHGNTSTDSHYGLPKIGSSLEELYQVELVPFISAIASGIDAIMTTHIIFNCLDSQYPATLSSKVLQGLLRNTLNYKGLIVTDGMEMGAIKSYFGTNDVTAVLAVQAGADILTYTGISGAVTGYSGVIKAVRENVISEERINESVRRIILTKIKYGLVDNYKVQETYPTSIVNANRNLALDLAKKSITLVKGSIDINKNEKILVVSPSCSYTIDNSLTSQSLACYVAKYLKTNGYDVTDVTVGSNNISNDDSTRVLNMLDKYDRVILAFSNVKTSAYNRTVNFVNTILSKKDNTIVIAMQTPYDAMTYNNLKNYVCCYSYQEYTVKALACALNKEYTLSGDLPIDKSLFD